MHCFGKQSYKEYEMVVLVTISVDKEYIVHRKPLDSVVQKPLDSVVQKRAIFTTRHVLGSAPSRIHNSKALVLKKG
jgi:hypothetical protein